MKKVTKKTWTKKEEALLLHLLEGMPLYSVPNKKYEEIGKLLERSPGSVRLKHTNLLKGRKKKSTAKHGVELPPAPVKLKTVAPEPQKQTITPAEAISVIVKHYKDAGLDAKVTITIGG